MMARGKAESREVEGADTETLVRLIAMHLGISDHNGVLMPRWERRLNPIVGEAYTASSVQPRSEDAMTEDPSADDAVRQLEQELALQQMSGREVQES
jgi:hypothetical protein